MKKSTYDAISAIAVVSLVALTVAAQHSSRAGYAFGVLAVLTAAGLFAAYVRALPPNSTADESAKAIEAAKQSKTAARKESLIQEEILMRQVRADMYRRLLVIERDPIEALFKNRMRERRLRLQSLEHHGTVTIRHVKIHPAQDAASTIVNVIEKLCAGSKEPRFDFILGPDGSFKIRQISVKYSVEEYGTREEPSEESHERKVIPMKIRSR